MKFCPHCGGDLSPYLNVSHNTTIPAQGRLQPSQPNEPYNQDRIWKSMQSLAEAAPPDPDLTQMVMGVVDATRQFFESSPTSTIVHLAFDRNVSLNGGSILSSVARGRDSEHLANEKRLRSLGYQFDDEGKIITVEDIPVPPAYLAIQWWGGEKQHRRWHLTKPVEVNPSRNGDPCFIDENMIAFRAVWKDGERLEPALLDLLETFHVGVKGSGRIANPVALLLAEER